MKCKFQWSILTSLKNISDDTQEMPQFRNTTLPRYQKKEKWGTRRTNATYETADAQQRMTATEAPICFLSAYRYNKCKKKIDIGNKELQIRKRFLSCSSAFCTSDTSNLKNKGKRKVQEVPQSQTAALPRH